MAVRGTFLLLTLIVCLLLAPAGRPTAESPAAPAVPAGEVPSAAEFEHLAKTDAVAMLGAALARYKADYTAYRCVFRKQERLGGTLGPVEVIRVTFRDDPFAVHMRWEEGITTAVATVYAAGENGGKMRVLSRVPFVGERAVSVAPTGLLPRQSARYAITDFGLYAGALRTFVKWKAAREAGRLRTEYLGTGPVPELGGRVCHRVRRACDPADVDNFELSDRTPRDAARHPKEAIGSVTVMMDAETFQQVGSELRQPNGDLLAAYFFRDVERNPPLPPAAFNLR